jgi:hypothetical protein
MRCWGHLGVKDEEYSHLMSVSDTAFKELLSWCNNSRPQDPPARVPTELGETIDIAKAYGRQVLTDILFRAKIPQHNESRWLAYMDSQEWFTKMLFSTSVPSDAWHTVHFACERPAAQNESDYRKYQRMKDGTRLATGRQHLRGRFLRFYQIVFFILCKHAEAAIYLYFFASSVHIHKAKRRVVRAKRPRTAATAGTAEAAASLGGGHPGEGDHAAANTPKICGSDLLRMSQCVHGMERHLSQLWKMFLDENCDLYKLAEAFWPQDSGNMSEGYATITDGLLTLHSELVHRFALRHGQEPYSLAKSDTKGKWIAPSIASVHTFLNKPDCCVRHVQPIRDYAQSHNVVVGGETPFQRVCKAVNHWDLSARATTLGEEHLLSNQKKSNERHDRKPPTYATSAAEFVCRNVMRNWHLNGGPDLRLASSETKRNMKIVQATEVDHKRPNQFGNPYFAYFWDELSPEDLPQTQSHSVICQLGQLHRRSKGKDKEAGCQRRG